MAATDQAMKRVWEESFAEQIARQAYNTAPAEAVIRTVSYYLRDRAAEGVTAAGLRFLEMGCGAGPNLLWLAQKGITVSGLDVAPTALALARETLERNGCGRQIGQLLEASVSAVPLPDASFDGIIESCVFQHLGRADREAAFREVGRLLKPGGVFVGYMLDAGHTIYRMKQGQDVADDPGTVVLQEGGSKVYLSNIGVSHFFRREEYDRLLAGFRVIDPCLTTYYIPKAEAAKRGYAEYLQSMWTVYAVK
jgi:SAM-dependent methyltransferase